MKFAQEAVLKKQQEMTTERNTKQKQLPDLESLFSKDKPLFKPGTEISMFMKHIPKHQELEKFVNYLKQRVIHECSVPLTVKELKAEYHVDPYFKDIVKDLEKDYCRYVGKAQTVFKMQCEDYVLVKADKGEPSLVLCICHATARWPTFPVHYMSWFPSEL